MMFSVFWCTMLKSGAVLMGFGTLPPWTIIIGIGAGFGAGGITGAEAPIAVGIPTGTFVGAGKVVGAIG